MLIFNEVLWYGNRLPVSLINPNQLRHNGFRVCDDVTDGDRYFGIELADDVQIPFQMLGTKVMFNSRVPTLDELEHCRQFSVTNEIPWDPTTVSIGAAETIKKESERSELRSLTAGVPEYYIQTANTNYGEQEPAMRDISATLNDRTFTERMISKVNIVSVESSMMNDDDGSKKPRAIGAMASDTRHSKVTVKEVSKKFRCGLETAKNTLKRTTQRGVRRGINPLFRRYRTDHADLNRRRLNLTMSTDALFVTTKSLAGNKVAQLYTTGNYTKVYPMANKDGDNTGDTLSDICRNVGIPKTLVCDLASEQVGRHTKFMKEVRRLGIDLKNAEKGQHKQNHLAEAEINQVT